MNEESCNDRFILWELTKSLITNNIDCLNQETSSLKLHGAFGSIVSNIDDGRVLYEKIESFCAEYDIDETVQSNGYRSFLKVFDSAINHVYKTVKCFTENQSKILFRKSHYMKEIEACNDLLTALIASFKQLITLHFSSENGNLFPLAQLSSTEILNQISEINQSAFYGRCLGFQYYDSIKNILKFISIFMASYSESYYSKKNSKFMRTSNTIYNSGRYYFDPEMLSKRLVDVSRNASVDFCKSFWTLTESEIIHSIPFVNYRVKVNRILKINPNQLKIPKLKDAGFMEVDAPGIVQMRLISAHGRCGMVGETDKKSLLPKSSELLFHCHGGGFVAQSSKSHLVYLLEWAVELNIPIVSVDYSLAPEFPYPYASNEIFYAYCWALKNCELLGWTGEKVALCGDSAGANLCLSTLIRSIQLGIRRADGIFIAYCPILVSFVQSPSRYLCLQDPLIPFGFLIKCLNAYVCSNDQTETVTDKACEAENDEKNSLSSNNTETSFEEVSCFECHQTDSDIKAHISNLTTASSDTLAGTSLFTEKNNKDTLEFDSPVSIRSAISLDKVSCHIECEDTSHLIPSTSENARFVDSFVEKYSLNVEINKNSNIRKSSRTRSEENIIFDVSRDTFCVRNIRRKFHYAASSIAKTFSSTFGEFTKHNHMITNSYEWINDGDVKPSCILMEDLKVEVPEDPLLSPFYVNDDILKEFPPIKIISLTLDSCLDDAVMFAKRLKSLNVCYTLDVLDKLPHGFLNFARLSKEAHEGSKFSMLRIAELLNLNLDLTDNKCCDCL